MSKGRCTAIVLAAGQGRRMGTKVQKQYLEILGFPVLYYSLKAFQESEVIDEIILVTGVDEIESCQKEFVEKYNLTKVTKVIVGGKERYDSVYNGLQCVSEDTSYIFIHDGARPMLNQEIIANGFESVMMHKATVAGVPSKDTVKIVDGDTFAVDTPNRSHVWNIQTPQIFEVNLLKEAYENMMKESHHQVTDDAMVVETYMNHKVKVYEASYTNIKITTPEDLKIAEIFLAP